MRYWVLIIGLLLGACQKENYVPSIPISQEKLVPVLADAYIAEAAINTLVGSVKDSMAEVYYVQLCEIHGITKADFDTTISIIQRHPTYMDSIYANVLRHLTELESLGKETPEKPEKESGMEDRRRDKMKK